MKSSFNESSLQYTASSKQDDSWMKTPLQPHMQASVKSAAGANDSWFSPAAPG